MASFPIYDGVLISTSNDSSLEKSLTVLDTYAFLVLNDGQDLLPLRLVRRIATNCSETDTNKYKSIIHYEGSCHLAVTETVEQIEVQITEYLKSYLLTQGVNPYDEDETPEESEVDDD